MSNNNQLWQYDEDNKYILSVNCNDKCLTAELISSEWALILDECITSNTNTDGVIKYQEWIFDDIDERFIENFDNSDQCIEIESGQLIVSKCNYAASQRWAFIYANATIEETVSSDNQSLQNSTVGILIFVSICFICCVILGICCLRGHYKVKKNAERSVEAGNGAEF